MYPDPAAWQADLEIAVKVLARLVRDEYPADHSLAEIAYIWGRGTREEVAALRRLEGQSELAPRAVNDLA